MPPSRSSNVRLSANAASESDDNTNNNQQNDQQSSIVVDNPIQIQTAIMNAYKQSQKAEKEAKGTNSTTMPSSTITTGRPPVGLIDSPRRRVSFDAKGQLGGAVQRSGAALGFTELSASDINNSSSQQQNAAAGAVIQPHQYPKLFSHSGFSPAAEEVYYASESARMSQSMKKNKNTKKGSRSSSMSSVDSMSSSSNKILSASAKNKHLQNMKKAKKNMSSEERRAAQRKLEAIDTIFSGTLHTSDSGSLKKLSESCMSLRPAAADNLPSSISARLDEVDQHAVFAVGPMMHLKGIEGITEVTRKLVEPYKVSSWKLSHLEASLSRVRAIYRWITAFVKLDAPPLPPAVADANYLQQQQNQSAGAAINLFPPSSGQQQQSALKSESKTTSGGKKVGIMAPSGGSKKDAKHNNNNNDIDISLNNIDNNNNPSSSALPTLKPPLVIPKWFPYKYQDCDDQDDADYIRSELSEVQPHLVPASGSFNIGEETSLEVFKNRVGDCHQISALFSFMIRSREARILPEYCDATEFSGLGVKNASSSELCAVSDRKTVAGPTGRAANKCDAARSPSAARRSERQARVQGGGSHPCSIVTVRGTLKGSLGANGRPAGYLPWSWSLLTLPDGNRYLLDVSMSTSQVSEKFSLVMGQHMTVADKKRTEAFTNTYNQLFNNNTNEGSGNNATSNTNDSSASHHAASSSKPAKSSSSSKKVTMKKEADAKSQAATASIANAFQQQQLQITAAAIAAEKEKQDLFKDLCSVTPSVQSVIFNNSSNNSSDNNNNNNSGLAVFIDSESNKKIEETLKEKPLPPIVANNNRNASCSTSTAQLPTFSDFAEAPLALNAPDLDPQTAAMNAQLLPHQQANQILLDNAQSVIKDHEDDGSNNNQSNQQQQQQSHPSRGSKSTKDQQGNKRGGNTSSSNQQSNSNDANSNANFGYPQPSANQVVPQNSQINEGIANSNPAHYAAQHLLSLEASSLLVKTFIPFFFFTDAQEFACSHFPRRAQHMLLSAGARASTLVMESMMTTTNVDSNNNSYNNIPLQPSQGVFKHPFSQGAWESYPRLSHKFLQLGLRLKSRSRRAMFSIAAPPEYFSIDASRGDPSRIETKMFVFKSTSAYALHATSPMAPTLPQVLISPTIIATQNNSADQQDAVQSGSNSKEKRSRTNTSGSPSPSSMSPAMEDLQPSTSSSSGSSSVVEKINEAHAEQITHWIRDQKYFLGRYWSGIITANPSSASSLLTAQQQSSTTGKANQHTNANNSASSAPSSSAALRLQQSLLPSRGWTSTTAQRSSGVFTHTLTVPEVGVYTCVIGVRELNPHTGRPLEPYFWPAVTYQVTCNFSASTEPLIAHQQEVSIAKVVRPLVAQLPANTSIPFAVAPLLPRVHGVAIINAIEKARPTKQQLLEKQQQLQKDIMILMQKQQAEDREKELLAQQQAALPPVRGASKSSSKKSHHSSKDTAKDIVQEPTELEKLQKQLQQLIQQQASDSNQKPQIERIKVHLLKWEPATACFQGEVYIESGNVSIWTIVEKYSQDLSPSGLDCAIQSQTQLQAAVQQAALLSGGGAGGKMSRSSNHHGSKTTSSGKSHHHNNQNDNNNEDGVSGEKLIAGEGFSAKPHPPELDTMMLEKGITGPTSPLPPGRALPRTMVPAEKNVMFSKFNPLCLPSDLQARGMDQILQSVIPMSSNNNSSNITTSGPSVEFLMANDIANNNNNGRLSKASSNGPLSKSVSSVGNKKPLANSKRRKSMTPSAGLEQLQAERIEPVNVNLETFTSTIKEASHLHQTTIGNEDTSLLLMNNAANNMNINNNEQGSQDGFNSQPRSNASTPAAFGNRTSKSRGGAGETPSSKARGHHARDLEKEGSSNQQASGNNNNNQTNTITLSLGSSTVFAVPLWTNISVQRKIQSKDIALMTNAVGLPHTLGVSEMALGMSGGLGSSFRRSSTASSAAILANNVSILEGQQPPQVASHTIVTSTAISPLQNLTAEDFEARRHTLVYPLQMDLEERNAVNLSLCAAGERHLKAHKNNVGKLFQRKKATF